MRKMGKMSAWLFGVEDTLALIMIAELSLATSMLCKKPLRITSSIKTSCVTALA